MTVSHTAARHQYNSHGEKRTSQCHTNGNPNIRRFLTLLLLYLHTLNIGLNAQFCCVSLIARGTVCDALFTQEEVGATSIADCEVAEIDGCLGDDDRTDGGGVVTCV